MSAMSFSPTSAYPTPASTTIVSPPTNAQIDKNSQMIKSVVAQPIPVKMAISRIHVEPQQGVLIKQTSTTPPTSSTSFSTTPTDAIGTTAKFTPGLGNSGVVGATSGSSSASNPRSVIQQKAPLPQQQVPLFITNNNNSTSSFFDKSNPSSPLVAVGRTTTTSSDKTVTRITTAPSIISSPHDNNKPSPSSPSVGIPCLVKQQPSSSSSTIKQISSDENASSGSYQKMPPNIIANDNPSWITTLNALKDQIQQIQHERQQEKLAYLERETERRALEQKMLDDIEKTGQQLAMFSQQLQNDQDRHRRSKSAERQPSTNSRIKGNSRQKQGQRRPHSFTSSTSPSSILPTSFYDQQQQQIDYHSAIEDESDHGEIKHKRHHHQDDNDLGSSSSSSSSSDGENEHTLQQSHRPRYPPNRQQQQPTRGQRHSPALQSHYSLPHPGYYYNQPPPSSFMHPPTRFYGNPQQQQPPSLFSSTSSSSYTFPPTSARDKRRHPPLSASNSLSSQQPPPSSSSSSSLQQQDQNPPSSSNSSTRFRPPLSNSSSIFPPPSYPFQRHMPPAPSFHPPYHSFHPPHSDNQGLFM